MRTITSALFFAVCATGLLTAGCRRKPIAPTPTAPELLTAARQETKGTGAMETEPQKILPPKATLPHAPPPKAWSMRNHGEKTMQIHYWLARHEYGTPAERAQIVAALKAAGLNASEREELEDLRSRYGYRRLQ